MASRGALVGETLIARVPIHSGETVEIHQSSGSAAPSPGDAAADAPSGAASMPPRVTITALADRIRGEFVEAPGLAITVDQAVRFWVLDMDTCAQVLGELLEIGFLVETANGYYRRRRTS